MEKSSKDLKLIGIIFLIYVTFFLRQYRYVQQAKKNARQISPSTDSRHGLLKLRLPKKSSSKLLNKSVVETKNDDYSEKGSSVAGSSGNGYYAGKSSRGSSRAERARDDNEHYGSSIEGSENAYDMEWGSSFGGSTATDSQAKEYNSTYSDYEDYGAASINSEAESNISKRGSNIAGSIEEDFKETEYDVTNWHEKNNYEEELSWEDERYLESIITSSDHLTEAYADLEQTEVARTKVPAEIMNMVTQYWKQSSFPKGQVPEYEIMMKLMTWFRKDFMQWVDAPPCTRTKACKTGYRYYTRRKSDCGNSKIAWSSHNVEVFKCSGCARKVEFPRYQDPESLLKYHHGRCGEFGNTFTFICRALGFDARLVYDRTDHVWSELYFPSIKRWVHCDPCEITCDTPLMYELGWNKTLTYVIAYSPEEVRDVTRRYSHNYERTKLHRPIDERILKEYIQAANEKRQKDLPESRRKVLKERAEREDKELMSPVNQERQYGGRTSGSLAWRKQRGEVSPDILENNGHVWILDEEEIAKKLFQLTYSCSKNKYLRGNSKKKSTIIGWDKGVYSAESIQRKVEDDSKICYLTREEGSPKSSISWKFQVPENSENLRIGKVKITLPSEKLTRNAYISITACSYDDANQNEVCLLLSSSEDKFKTEDFSGSSALGIKVVMAGGDWHQTQLFRTSQEMDNIFKVKISLARKPYLHLTKSSPE